MTGVSGLNSVEEDKTMMFKTYSGPLSIHPYWSELPSGACCSADLIVAKSRGEENDARDTTCCVDM